jgi:N-glycosylase/DNA lyase
MEIRRASFSVENYDLAATLTSGQAFRWRQAESGWEGVIGERWVRLRQTEDHIEAETTGAADDWAWLRHYLQLDVHLDSVAATFPTDEPMQTALRACRGLRLLRQEPWECLASFICSSTKRIVQIQQIIDLLCRNFGEPLPVPRGAAPAWSFPSAQRLATVTETELRACKLGFRAPYLGGTARRLAAGEVKLEGLFHLTLDQAREELLKFPGVGVKIADCVLLFGYGFPAAFPMDVWIMKALRQLYFPKRRPKIARLRSFSQTHFGPHAGFAQQYLFHYMRVKGHSPSSPA